MVNESGQLYTIEGIAAGMIMLVTAYLVLGATSVYTPGDTHISDMQLEQLGTDALRMMNTPVNGTSESQLREIIENDDANAFNTQFLNYVNSKTGTETDNLHYVAEVSYRNITDGGTTWSYPLADNNRPLTGGEHPVRVTEWVIVHKTLPPDAPYAPKDRAVLVEVLLWRD
ncbi:MAG TPA: hypothetical protein PKM50_07090 [Methanoregula sp.]|nr:hypothetical protein [Methanoregula sp.]